jgi:hypothetical protein
VQNCALNVEISGSHWDGAANSVGDPGRFAFRYRQSDRRERMAIEKVEHCCADFYAPVGDNV